MKEFYKLKNQDVFNYLPVTFHISRGKDDPEYKNFIRYFNKREKEIAKQDQMTDSERKKVKALRNIWIVKVKFKRLFDYLIAKIW